MFFIHRNKVNKKVIIINFLMFFIIIMVFILVIWMYPIKRGLKEELLFENYDNEKIILLCIAGGNTGPEWNVIKYSGIDIIPSYDIDIVGYTPDKILKNPIYI